MGKHIEKKFNKKKIFLNILIAIFVIVLIISIIYIVKWILDNRANQKITDKVEKTIINTSKNGEIEYIVDFKELKEINKQVVGWLKVKGTEIEYPVVQAKDNNYYLKRNLERNYNVAGWVFADYKNKFDGTDKNIVIYGHNMKDNSMFGSLKNILNEKWYNNEENYIIDFITEKEQQKYHVFSVYKIENEDYYINTEFNGNQFVEFIKTLQQRSIKDFNTEVSEDDQILTLSTCADNNKYRVVAHAKKISN